MPKKYTSEQFWELYEKLPQELKDALFAEETGDNIYEICKKNEAEKNFDQIVECVSQILTGVLNPEDFKNTLEKDLKIEKETAKKIAQEINRFIFYPVKAELTELYKMDIAPEEKTEIGKAALSPEGKPAEITPLSEKKPQTSSGKDTYREEIE